jgi:hypothetical protein
LHRLITTQIEDDHNKALDSLRVSIAVIMSHAMKSKKVYY